MDTKIEFDNYTLAYGRDTVLNNITLAVPRNAVLAVFGPAGSGKSGLLRSINRMAELEPNERHQGDIRMDQQSVFAPEKFCHLPFKFAVQIRHAGKHRRTACAETVRPQRFMRCGEDFGMICQPEVIVGTEVYYRAWPAVVIDGRACVGTREQLWFIKFHRERGLSHPMCESGRRLERVARFVRQKITETEFCRVLTHQVVNRLSLASVSTEEASRQSSELWCFTDSLRSCPLHPYAAEFRLGAANLAGFGF